MRTSLSKALVLSCVLLLGASSTLTAGPAPYPKHIDLPRHKRGYTVYTPADLEPNKTYPALIWLHPLGSNMNTRIRQDWWDDLNRRKVFLVFPESVESDKWTDADVPYLMDLASDLPRRFHVDRRKLILFGYEAGGQFAFTLAHASPSRFASLITMAAYPVSGSREPVVWLFPDSVRRSLSLLMIVGTADNGRAFCRQAAEQLLDKGFAVALVEVPDAAQAYLASVKPDVLSWLDQIVAGTRPSLPLPESERLARQALKDAADKLFDAVLAPPDQPEPENVNLFRLKDAGLSVRMPPGWKLIADEPDSARFTTTVPPAGPLLVQLALEKDPRGLDHALKDHDARNRTRGIRYTPLRTAPLQLPNRSWKLQQATCLSYHRQPAPGGKTKVVDAPSVLTVCYLPLDTKSTEYVRVVFLYTPATAGSIDLAALVRQVLASVAPLPGRTLTPPVIE